MGLFLFLIYFAVFFLVIWIKSKQTNSKMQMHNEKNDLKTGFLILEPSSSNNHTYIAKINIFLIIIAYGRLIWFHICIMR